ncbi:MAG TPA: glycoside hydrolase family 25 protein, partial [Lacipirellulaceae bacterium]|nr:glycoside hydrolase family 25 protein [Lacipirellulaceae bacterium]
MRANFSCDVSQWQSTAIDWSAVRSAGKDFVFVRATKGDATHPEAVDTRLAPNVTGAWQAGMLVGVYHTALPDAGVNDAQIEAQWFLQNASQYIQPGFMRPVVSVEFGSGLGKAALTQWVETFIDHVETATGVEPLIYTNSNYATNFLGMSLKDNDLWLARWNSVLPNPQSDQPETPSGYANPYGIWNEPFAGPPSHGAWSFWQYSSTQMVPGITANFTDTNVYQGNVSSLTTNFVIPPATEAFPSIGINFGPDETAVPSGYINFGNKTFGSVFGLQMGWDAPGVQLFSRAGGVAADQRYRTYAMPNQWGGSSRTFELAVPNGTYQVRAVAGSPDQVGNTHKFFAEGNTLVSAVNNSV